MESRSIDFVIWVKSYYNYYPCPKKELHVTDHALIYFYEINILHRNHKSNINCFVRPQQILISIIKLRKLDVKEMKKDA